VKEGRCEPGGERRGEGKKRGTERARHRERRRDTGVAEESAGARG